MYQILFRPLAALVIFAAPAHADGFCEIAASETLFETLAGEWDRDGAQSLENATTSMLRASAQYTVKIGAGGMLNSTFIDSLTGAPIPLTLAEAPVYDVDGVDDILDTIERADIADTLSDTRCGPEALPQLTAEIPVTSGISAGGTITIIAYFDDRLLQITELELKSDETILFLTEAAILTRTAK